MNSKIIVALFLLLGIVVIGGGILILTGHNEINLSIDSKPTPTIINDQLTPKETPKVKISPTIIQPTKSTNPNLKTFTSTNLGTTFSYLEKQNEETITTKEIGNKVYIYSTATQPTTGQYVEVFNKNQSQSLEDAIRQQFLTGYLEKDCLLKAGNYAKYPDSFVTAEIRLPTDSNDDMGTLEAKAKKCPEKYVSFGGISYFLEDKNHPDKFVYFGIGQYAILSEGGLTWQETIRFLD